MPWFKVDDSFHSHPKAMRASLAALGLWSVAGSWSGDHLTDGFVPDYMLPLLSRGAGELADELVAAGLWRRTRGGYQFHQWDADADGTRRNFTAEEVAKRREKRADAGRKGGQQKAANAVDQPKQDKQMPSSELANAEALAKQTPSTDPKSPGALKEKEPLRGSKKKPAASQARGTKRGTRIPEGFAVSAAMADWARSHTPEVDPTRETEKFINYWLAKSGKDATKRDWEATWRNWMLKAQEYAQDRSRPVRNGVKPTKDDKIRQLQAMKGRTNVHYLEGGAG